ncbi:alpha-L-fucosidase [Candidatus Solincola sp.]|nr:alpha-L-fucosidase [Actinomycetota bacterium]MDI7251386.1 alpha-L-fucosidase [Actinomycetota bacterium]
MITSDRNLFKAAEWVATEIFQALARTVWRLILPVPYPSGPDESWYKKPGLGIMYQIEYRPGMDWDRDYEEFNRSMMDDEGKLNFNGPFCRIDEWVELSKDVGVDYHIFESKWHDGICYFNTELTGWKTETDYCRRFAELSRRAGIPFMFYYSAILDHNPLFDPIQPNPHSTFSVLSMESQPMYEDYLRGQYRELMDQYHPDGMWIDWYWPDRATELTIDFFRTNYPETVITFNFSNYFPSSYHKLDYTSGEAHDLAGFYIKLVKTGSLLLPILTGAWKWATLFRRVADHPWELITPSGKWWQDPTLREDPYELLRMAAVILGSGGKLCVGASAQLNGELYPDQVKQLKMLGEWYKPRKKLFTESIPLRYRRREVPGIRISPPSVKSMACIHGGNVLLHLVNMDGITRPIVVEFKGRRWGNIARIYLEPTRKELGVERNDKGVRVVIRPEDIDPVDIILRLKSL